MCATFAFVGASRFVLTNSFTEDHNMYENNPGQGFVDNASGVFLFFKLIVFPTFLVVAGIVLIVFGFGQLGVLGFCFGMPSLGLSIMALINIVCGNRGMCNGYENYNDNFWYTHNSDNLWSTFMIMTGFMSITIFEILELM